MKTLLLLIPFALISCKDDPAPTDPPKKETPSAPQLKDQSPTPKSSSPAPETTKTPLIPPPTPPAGGKPVPLPGSDPPPPPVPTKFPTALAIPRKPGWVFNPWTNRAVDVRGIPAGSIVRDPNDPTPDRRFRTPAP